ncbi:hypothetical protein ACFLSF_04455, partial [Candidatus Bipolaricaulota bacterium]
EFAWYGHGGARGQRSIAFTPPALLPRIMPVSGEGSEQALAEAVLEYLVRHGASFLQPIARALDAAPSDVAATLWELMWSGRVTNDSLALALGSKPRPTMWDGRKHSGWISGRWSALPTSRRTASGEDLRAVLEILLHRYGVLSRELVVRDGVGVRWSDAYPLLSRMEWAGDVERGFFVSGLSTPQFATRTAINGLRAPAAFSQPILLHVSDPACVFGDLFPVTGRGGNRLVVRRLAGNHIMMRGGRPMLLSENRRHRLTPLTEMDGGCRREVLSRLSELIQGREQPARLRVEAWDGQAIVDSPAADDLVSLGFVGEDRAMILYRGYETKESR